MNGAERRRLLGHLRDEAAEHAEEIARALLAFEKAPGETGLHEEIMRRAHSLKGSARMMGAGSVEGAAAAFESVMAEVRAGRLPLERRVMDPLLEALDAVRAWGETGAGEAQLEQVAFRLMSLASVTMGLDDALARLLPGLDPAFRESLTEYQKSRLVSSSEAGKYCCEALLAAPPGELASLAGAVHSALKGVGEVVGLAGLGQESDGRLRLKFLLVTRRSGAELEAPAAAHGLILSDPALPLAAAAAASEAEQEFEKEVAELFQQYVAAEYEKLDELPRLIMSVEAAPDDQELVNELFRAAHNLKSSGATFGLKAVSKLAHQMEGVIAAVRDKKRRMTPRAAGALLKAADGLKDLFGRARGGERPELPAAELVRELESAFLDGAHPPAAAAPSPAPPPHAAPRETIRVSLPKLDRLANLADELTISRNTREAAVKELESLADAAKSSLRQWRALKDVLPPGGPDGLAQRFSEAGAGLSALAEGLDAAWNRFSATTLHSDSTASAVQEGVMRMRMVPAASLFDSAPRLVRDLTADGAKAVSLSVTGGQTEVDRRVPELMADPLLHLLRNAVDHGLESPAERRAAGKPEAGALALGAEQRGSSVVITVRDDGRGLDPVRLAAKAVERGLVSPEGAAKLTKEQSYAFIFHPGFTTKDQVTSVSGRGVGMDVVRANVEALKGVVEIESQVGRGTEFRIVLPLSISVVQAILVETAGRRFCFQSAAVTALGAVGPEEISSESGRACAVIGGETVPLVRLAGLLGLGGGAAGPKQTVLVASGPAGKIGFAVDRAVREETVVLKEFRPPFSRVPYTAGGTLLADGGLAVILDTPSLLRAASGAAGAWAGPAAKAAASRARRVLVVDDSLTTRQLLRSLAAAAGYEVETAASGSEAWSLAARGGFDAVISDVNMPGLDGFELTARIKADKKLAATPVILVTSLSKEEEKLRGLRAGADAYIAKGAFDQNGLLARLKELTGE